MIHRPRLLFVDTGHLITLAELGMGRSPRGAHSQTTIEAYNRLREMFGSGECCLALYEPSVYEWIHGNSLQGALQIAAVFEKSLCVKRILPDPVIFVVEAMQECSRLAPEIPFPPTAIVGDLLPDPGLATWFNEAWPRKDERPNTIPVAVASGRSTPTVSSYVRSLYDYIQTAPDLWNLALQGEAESLARTRETIGTLGSNSSAQEVAKRFWLRSCLELDKVLSKLGPRSSVDQLLNRIELGRCPAMRLKLDAYWNYAKATVRPLGGDMIDLTVFAVIPYVDLALIENRMHEFVRQVGNAGYGGRCFRKPEEVVSVLLR